MHLSFPIASSHSVLRYLLKVVTTASIRPDGPVLIHNGMVIKTSSEETFPSHWTDLYVKRI